ncbi:MAG: hypothetical protein ACRD2U_07100 [Terriglobales bacterium]
MNRDEHRYRWTGWALIALLGLWIGAILLAWELPATLWKTSHIIPVIFFEGIFPTLLVVAMVLGVVRMVSYIRWTGKYPYYFLFGKAHGTDNPVDRGQEGRPSEKNGSA